MNFSVIVKDKRIEFGLTQGRLSDLAGVNQSTISKLEAGRIQVSFGIAKKIAKVLGIELVIKEKTYEKR